MFCLNIPTYICHRRGRGGRGNVTANCTLNILLFSSVVSENQERVRTSARLVKLIKTISSPQMIKVKSD